MRSHDMLWMLMVVTLIVGVIAPAQAQDAPAPAPAAATPSADEKIASLEKQIASLITSVRQLATRQPKPDQAAQNRENFGRIFKLAKEQAGAGCKAAGGKLKDVTVDAVGKVASVRCEW